MNTVERLGPVGLVLILFLVVGAGIWVNILWGLLTGGPRAKTEPGAPYLYNRIYYLQFLFAMVGWTIGIVSFPGTDETNAGMSFLFGWGICAIGMGSIFAFRLPMLLRGSRYLAEHGQPLFRWYHKMQLAQLDRMEMQSALLLKLMPFIFVLAGLIVTVVSLLNFSAVVANVQAGLTALMSLAAG